MVLEQPRMTARPALLVVSTVARTLEAFLTPFGEHFRSRGWRVEAASGGPDVPAVVAQAFDDHHLLPISRSPRSLAFGGAVRSIQALVASRRFDLVHVHTPVASFVVRAALRASAVPVVYTAHGFHFFPGGSALRNAMFASAERLAREWTTALVVLNAADRVAAIERLGFAEQDVWPMPGIGVNVERVRGEPMSAPVRAQFRAGLGVQDGQTVFLYPAEFNPGKRHVDAVRALALLRDPRAVLVLAGDGRLRGHIEELARSVGVASQVRFLGFRRDLHQLMKVADVMLFPSEREGLPRSMLEGACCGLPIIGSSARGVVDLLDDDRGVVVPVRDVLALAAAMQDALENPDDLRRRAARATAALDRYSERAILARHEDLYASVLSRSPRTGR